MLDNICQGFNEISQKLCKKKILLIIDDVGFFSHFSCSSFSIFLNCCSFVS